MQKLLVAYSTWAGSTRQIAETIKNELQNFNIQVTINDARDVTSISDYQCVILGSSIHMGQVSGDFKKFLKRFQKSLLNIPTAFFVVSFNMIEDTEKNRSETMNWLLRATNNYINIKPISIGLFAGAAVTEGDEFSKLNILVKKMIESMKSSMISQHGKSDFREPDKIQQWAKELINKIS